MINPYQPPKAVVQRTYGDDARLVRSAFLFRVIVFKKPFQGQLRYSSWWWRQRIDVNGFNVWFRISWIRIHRRAEFNIPASADRLQPAARIEIELSRIAAIRRFRFWVAGQLVYDEAN